MNKTARTISVKDTQGAKANLTGSLNEFSVNRHLQKHYGLSPKPRAYQSMWYYEGGRASKVDCDLQELEIVAEFKYQQVPGSCDQKGGTELYNAGQRIQCRDYILVYSGPHWDDGRGAQLFKMYKKMADNFNKHPKTFCIAAKKVHVMKEKEFYKFVEERKKEIL